MAKVDKTVTDFRKILEPLARAQDARQVFDGFCRLAACALACQTREPEYLEEAKRWKPTEIEAFSAALAALINEMQEKPFEDVLGGYYMDFALTYRGQQWNGEFHTPKPVCDMMARITLAGQPLPEDRPITVCEPACGAGAMILAVGAAVSHEQRRRLRVTAIDINATACDMCFINTTLWGIPCRVIHGNTLSMELWHAWSNIHYIMPWLPLAMRARTPEAQAQGEPPTEQETQQLKHALQYKQLELV